MVESLDVDNRAKLVDFFKLQFVTEDDMYRYTWWPQIMDANSITMNVDLHPHEKTDTSSSADDISSRQERCIETVMGAIMKQGVRYGQQFKLSKGDSDTRRPACAHGVR